MKAIHGSLGDTKKRPTMLIWVGLFAAIGVITLLVTRAATFGSAIEPENASSIISGASVVNDGNASNGKYVKFVGGAVQPPAGVQFFEGFDSDQRNRFDWRLQTTVEPPRRDFLGDHDTNMPCNGPTTHRTVHQLQLAQGVPHSNVDATNSEMVWWCAPGNDSAKGHMMTALDTDSIATLSFSPKQSFNNVSKVCWDQNMTNLGEGKWLNIFVVPAADVAAHNGDLAYAAGSAIAFGGVPQMLPPGAVDFTWLRGSIFSDKIQSNGTYTEVFNQWMSIDPTDTNGDGKVGVGDAPTKGMAADPAPRFTICIESGRTVTIERPDGSFDTYQYNTTFPTGSVRVIFQDASYNPTKHNGFEDHLTWHWDNITIQ